MSSTIRWGILGTGTIANHFAEGLQSLPDATIQSVGSRTKQRASDFGQRYGASKSHDDYRRVVEDPDVDIVYVATPHHRHSDDCLLSLDAGKAVLCEKPFTLNRTQAQDVIARARQNNLFCMEAMWMRFMPLVQRMKSMIDAGDIGTVDMINVDFGLPAPADPENRFFNPQLGGGALLDRGVYCISLAQYLLGTPKDISSHVRIGATGVDEQSSISFRYESGAIAVLNSSLTTKMRNEALVLGNRGSLRLDEYFFKPEYLTHESYLPPTDQPDPNTSSSALKQRLKSNKLLRGAVTAAKRLKSSGSRIHEPVTGNGYNYEAAEAMRCLRDDLVESPHMNWQDSLDVMQIMDIVRADWGLKYPGE